MFALRGRAGLALVVGVLFLALGSSLAYAKAAPTIDDLAGTYDVKIKATQLFTPDGSNDKDKFDSTWEISTVSDTEVDVYMSDWDVTLRAYYNDGSLVFADGDPLTMPATFSDIGIIRASGKSGKVSLKGEYHYSETDITMMPPFSYYEYDTISGKMTSSDDADVAPAMDAEDVEADDSADDAKSSSDPLPVEDILGIYDVRINGKGVNLNDGSSFNGKIEDVWTITAGEGNLVNVASEADMVSYTAYYENGILTFAQADDETLASNAISAFALATGKSGKTNLKGQIIRVEDLGGTTNEGLSGKFTAKKTSELPI